MDQEKVCVLGAGTMGRGIAQVFAEAGFEVLLIDVNEEQIRKGLQIVRKYLGYNHDQQEVEAILSRISYSLVIDERVAEYPLIVEAVPEDLELKKRVFRQVEQLVGDDVILATNTSQIPVTSIASACEKPQRFLGMHFSNPPHRMELVEIIKGLRTSPEVVEEVVQITRRIGKEPYVVNDAQGFVVSRIAAAVILEGIRILEEGVCDRDTLDGIVKTGLHHPMGPLELADHVGLDVLLASSEGMRNAFGDRYRPPGLLRRYVEAGLLGKKTGEGFYKYER